MLCCVIVIHGLTYLHSLVPYLTLFSPDDDRTARNRSVVSPDPNPICTSTQDDSQMKELEGRVAALELAKKFEATQEAVQEERMKMLAQLRAIKAELAKSGGGGGASSKELEAMREENARLKEQMAKQAYRIEHLCDSVKELQAKVKA